jgi:DNA-binding HxlR family transcriptional regulator
MDIDITKPILPTIHLNGTDAETLRREYNAARKSLNTTIDELVKATCNQRDFYPQDPGAWERAKAERAEVFRLLESIKAYVQSWEFHAYENKRHS